MAEVKWIKIVTDIFNNKKIRIIESMPEGDAIIVIWFKLLMLAGNINEGGNVFFTRDIPYTDQMLSTLFNRPVTTVQLALKTFVEFNMIDIFDDIIHVSNWEKYQNVEGMEKIREQTRARVAKYRENKRLQCNVTCNATVTDGNAIDIDIEEDKEKDINISTSKQKHKYGEFKHVTLTDEQYKKLVEDYGEQAVLDGIRNVDEYCEEKGKTYKNYNLTLRKWGIKSQPLPKKKPEEVVDPDEEARQKAWEEGFHDA